MRVYGGELRVEPPNTIAGWRIVEATTSHDGDRVVHFFGHDTHDYVKAMVALSFLRRSRQTPPDPID